MIKQKNKPDKDAGRGRIVGFDMVAVGVDGVDDSNDVDDK